MSYITSFNLFAVDLIQENVEKDPFIVEKQSIQRKIHDLSQEHFYPSILSDSNGMLSTNLGFKVEEHCLNKLEPKKLYNTLQETVVEGLQRLLDISGADAEGSLTNALKLTELLSSEDKIMLFCSEPSGRFDNNNPTQASSSVQSKSSLNPQMRHPYISIDLQNNDIKGIESNSPTADNTVKNILFHSIMHNIGNEHDARTVEYAYTCSDCAFPRHSKERELRACEICKGNYNSSISPEYLEDFIAYMDTLSLDDYEISLIGLKTANLYMKTNALDSLGFIALDQMLYPRPPSHDDLLNPNTGTDTLHSTDHIVLRVLETEKPLSKNNPAPLENNDINKVTKASKIITDSDYNCKIIKEENNIFTFTCSLAK